MRELLIRLVYCEMLGVECSWGYIHAIKMTQSGQIMDKRIGMYKYRLHTVAVSLGNQARGVQPACTMTRKMLEH